MVQTGLMRRILRSMVCIVSLSLSQAHQDVDAQLPDVFGTKPPPSCTCMPFHKCKKNTTENKYGGNPLDVRNTDPLISAGEWDTQTEKEMYPTQDRDVKQAECQHYLDRCCYPQDQDSTTSPQPVTTPPPSPTENTCGASHPDGVGFKITGDEHIEANYGEFPWIVAVIRRDKMTSNITIKVMECGGSIIHPQAVLTAAHCVQGKKDLLIRAGEWDTQTDKEMYPTQDRDVKQAIVHEGYYARGLHNDVALLVLDKPLELNDVVGTLCLPEQDEQMEGRNCVVSGWGKDVYGKKGVYQVILKRVDQLVVSSGPCQDALQKTRLGPRFRLHESFICAGVKEGKNGCKGDGGGPLACPIKGDSRVYVQAGILSWGIGCGTTTPAVYANVPHFRKWIDEKIASLNLI